MEFTIRKEDLVHELQTVTGVVEKRATLPILANLLLETGPTGLEVGIEKGIRLGASILSRLGPVADAG